jgi:hypothetical protein
MRRLAVTLAVAALAAGCGGERHAARPAASRTGARPAATATPSATPAGKAAYVAAMRGYGAAAARATALLDRHPTPAQLRAALRSVATARTGMARLQPPAEVRQAHRDYATAFGYSTGRLLAALRAELAGATGRARRIEAEDLPRAMRSRFNRALIVFGERRYAIRP